MRYPPKGAYNGLTIVLSQPSRYDLRATPPRLLTNNAGEWFMKECLPEVGLHPHNCDIRELRDPAPFLPNTSVLVCLGLSAQRVLMEVDTSLEEQRGSPVVLSTGMIAISSFLPQDAFDPVNHEKRLNQAILEDEKGKAGKNEKEEKTHRGKTDRANFRFWLKNDMAKASFLLKHKMTVDETPIELFYDPIPLLQRISGPLFLDIETADDLSMRCFAFGEMNGPVYAVSMMNYKNIMRPDWVRILLELCLAVRRSTLVVTHNGGLFDIVVLSWRYGLPFFSWNLYDTLVANHRCYLDVEKSLGHCISLWTFEPYHKNTGVYNPHNHQQDVELMTYCGKDVSSMRMVYMAQRKYIEKDQGLVASVDCAMQGMCAYIPMLWQGLLIHEAKRVELYQKLLERCTLLSRVFEILIGQEVKKFICPNKGKPAIGSSKQLGKFFHLWHEFPAIGYTKGGQPKLGELEIYKLIDKIEDDDEVFILLLKLIIAYRGAKKAAGDLVLKPWFRTFKEWRQHYERYSQTPSLGTEDILDAEE